MDTQYLEYVFNIPYRGKHKLVQDPTMIVVGLILWSSQLNKSMVFFAFYHLVMILILD